MYWIVYLTSLSLSGVSFLSNDVLLIWSIEIGDVEIFGVDKLKKGGDI